MRITKLFKTFIFCLCLVSVSALDISAQDQAEESKTQASADESAVKEETPPAEAAEAEKPTSQEGIPVEVNGDEVEFSIDENKVYAKGNVVVIRGKLTLKCDSLEYSRDTGIAVAEGNVVLIMAGQGTLEATRMTFNYETMKGDFTDARFDSHPYYGAGRKIVKVSEDKIVIHDGYITTSDFDDPEYRLISKTVDFYPGDKAVGKHVRLLAGKVPLIYIPRFTQKITDDKPAVVYTPGYTKDWGAFLLTQYRYHINEDLKGVIHLDYRELKDFAWGIDANYRTTKYGDGVIRTYYTNERTLGAKRFFEERIRPTTERERFKGEWRHKWKIDNNTDAIWQYYRLSDKDFLKDFFENEFDDDSNPETFFLLTKTVPKGTLSFRTDVRVNRFVGAVERLPELKYNLTNAKIGDTRFYLKSVNTYSNLVKKSASPSDIRQKTMRFDTDNELSYPFKFKFIELRPFVGGEQTYYSRTMDPFKKDRVRTIFKTGSDLSTKIFKIFDVKTKFLGAEINRLRHIITPTIAYRYIHDPSIFSSQLDQYDSIDARTRSHKIDFSFENKLQTKRKGASVDLVRAILSTDFLLKEDPGRGSFNFISTDIEIDPVEWLTFFSDTSYDVHEDHLDSANYGFTVDKGKWFFDFEKRYHRAADDQITTEWGYIFNPKLKFQVFQRFDIDGGQLKEQNYRLTRDLHTWEMEINFNETRNEGNEILLVFRLKAFPDLGFDFGASFNRRKAGSSRTTTTE